MIGNMDIFCLAVIMLSLTKATGSAVGVGKTRNSRITLNLPKNILSALQWSLSRSSQCHTVT